MSLRRNSQGQLGFHVTHEGLVTEVETNGPAWQVQCCSVFVQLEVPTGTPKSRKA